MAAGACSRNNQVVGKQADQAAVTTQEEYLRYVRKLAPRVQRDPAELDEAQMDEITLYRPLWCYPNAGYAAD